MPLIPVDCFHLEEVDNPFETIFRTYGELHRHRIAPKSAADLLDHAQKIRPCPVHLVDKREARNAILIGLAPNGLGLGLDTTYRAKHTHRAI